VYLGVLRQFYANGSGLCVGQHPKGHSRAPGDGLAACPQESVLKTLIPATGGFQVHQHIEECLTQGIDRDLAIIDIRRLKGA
jgi:hypothetical protein